MKVLTDTHTLVWALSESEVLGRAAREALARSPLPRVSPISGSWFGRRATAVGWSPIHFPGGRDMWCIVSLAGLPDLHKDPFDRMLVAQALAEGFTLASKDTILARYGAPVVWE